jgi:hypothetical protein
MQADRISKILCIILLTILLLIGHVQAKTARRRVSNVGV